MLSRESMQWLEQNKILEISKNHSQCFKKVLTDCLAAKDENILIIGDKGFEDKPLAPIIASGYYFAARELGINSRLILQEPKFKGDEADRDVIDALYDINRENIIILALSGRLGSIKELGKSFRTYTNENYHRFVSSTSLGMLSLEQLSHVINSIDVNYDEMHGRGLKIKERLDNGEMIHIVTDAGTDLFFGIKGKTANLNTGHYTKPRTGGNIPAGEVYIVPKWKNVEGKIVIDGSSRYRLGTQLIKEPIILTIKKDEIVNIEGGEEADKLSETLDWAYKKAKYPWGIKRIGELGIGINPNAGIIGASIIDEKTLGTAHVGIGSNYWFGGTIYAIIHLDQIFKNPKIYVDDELLEV